MLEDTEAVFERYSIMIEQPDVTEKEVLNYIQQHTSKDNFRKFLLGEK